jgi:hypothetical protein
MAIDERASTDGKRSAVRTCEASGLGRPFGDGKLQRRRRFAESGVRCHCHAQPAKNAVVGDPSGVAQVLRISRQMPLLGLGAQQVDPV